LVFVRKIHAVINQAEDKQSINKIDCVNESIINLTVFFQAICKELNQNICFNNLHCNADGKQVKAWGDESEHVHEGQVPDL